MTEQPKVALSECPLPEESIVDQQTGSAHQSLLLSSYPYFFNSNQWHPQYLSKDFAKYQIVLDPLGFTLLSTQWGYCVIIRLT